MRSGTPIGRVRGLGSAKHGAHHWWHQRLSAATNLFLMAWLLVAIARMPGYDYAAVRLWLSSAWVAVPMALLIVSVFYHARLGLQVAIEDYTEHAARIASLVVLNVFVLTLAAIALFAILKVAFAGAPA